jgi:hypothetical protein
MRSEGEKAGCNFDSYRPLKIGTPIRGGHEELALQRPSPVYPGEALSKGIGGPVVVHVLINRAGDVVKACGAGPVLLATAAEEALSKWKFRRDFGLGLAGSPPGPPTYAELTINFDFDPGSGQSQSNADLAPPQTRCAEMSGWAKDRNGSLIWLTSDELVHRALHKVQLTFPMLGHGRLRGDVRLNIGIDIRGRVTCADAIDGHPIAIAAAMAVIRDWRFKPYVQNGRSAPVLGHLTIAYDSAR